MAYLYLVLVAIVCFGGLLFSFHKWQLSALYCFAIGGAVNSNFFHIGDYPIFIGNFVFGIDSVIYTLFIFCVIITADKFGNKDAMKLTYSSMGAIGFAAVMQFIADWSQTGVINTDITWSLISFIASIVATLIAVVVILRVYEHLKQKNYNRYFSIGLVMLIASLINSFIYFGVVAIWNGGLAGNFGWILISSYIGKIMSICFSLFTFYLLKIIQKKQTSLNSTIDKI